MDANPRFGIYVISVDRWERGVITGKNLLHYRYVVRKSQEIGRASCRERV